ncbi:universal stress protein [Caenimonas aquaedulcis]|uniref:Universal stress protein n=1 Tax=Caenimonas aquaedulcis TaxID=2793270 RepID=A0A931MIJ5_9BURK|nr:universal stress protein [Caenimonas aquaedulcis]MBG9390211.1 universal stress protein [Caenimonas aquaedulcis]
MQQTYAQLLVHLDATPHAARRLSVARAIAQKQGAAVTGLYAVTPSLLAIPFASEGGANAAAVLAEVDADRCKAARAMFDRGNATDAVQAAWAQTDEFPIASSFALQALHADLLVFGQFDGTDPSFSGVPADFIESVLAQSGKPALVLPHEGHGTVAGNHVVIAWKPTREAARAVAAAVPLLQRASRVHVLSWGGEEERVAGASLGLDGYLKLRGIEATWHREGGAEPAEVGDLLLSRAFDLDADLLVMGCYGHSRAREWVLGGASRTVLRSMTLPVLMAH